MEQNEMKYRMKDGFLSLAPDASEDTFEEILKKGYPTELVMEKQSNSIHWNRFTMPLVAACIMLVCMLGYFNINARSYVTLDVNPSVCMTLDKKGRVIKLEGLNKDGENLVNETDYHKKDSLDAVINNVLVQMNSQGYISSEESMLVTVCAKEEVYSDLKDTIVKQVKHFESSCGNIQMTVAVLHTADKTSGTGCEQLEEYLANGDYYNNEDLSDLSVEELLACWKKVETVEEFTYGTSNETVNNSDEKSDVELTKEEKNATDNKKKEKNTIRQNASTTAAVTESIHYKSETPTNQTTESPSRKETKENKEPGNTETSNKKEQQQQTKEDKKEQHNNKKEEQQQKKEEKQNSTEAKENPSTTRETNANSEKKGNEKSQEKKKPDSQDENKGNSNQEEHGKNK